MKAVLVFLGLAAACASAQNPQEPNLRIKFDIAIPLLKPNDGTKFFIPIPMSKGAVVERGWKVTPHPEVPLPSIELWCNPQDYVVCVYLDIDTGNLAGVQVAVPKNELYDLIYDLTVQGWVDWTPEDGNSITYVVQKLFFQSKEFLEKSAEERLASYNNSTLIQDAILYTGFNGQLDRFSADQTDLDQTSDFTKQACIPFMGRHYYYRMTPATQCRDDTMYPWFPLVHSGKIIGSGLMLFGKKNQLKEGQVDYHEHPSKAAVQAIVNSGPDCLYKLAEEPGVITSHIYFIDKPIRLGCLKN